MMDSIFRGLDDEELFIIDGHANSFPSDVAIDTVV